MSFRPAAPRTENAAFANTIMELVARAPKVLRRGEPLQAWCHDNFDSAQLKMLEKLGLLQDNSYHASPIYQDDLFEYIHVHIPKAIMRNQLKHLFTSVHGKQEAMVREARLLTEAEWRILLKGHQDFVCGTGWEHYQWHAPEPHVLLLRRRLSAPVVNPQSPMVNPEAAGPSVLAEESQTIEQQDAHAMALCSHALNDAPLDVQLAAKGLSLKLFPENVPELLKIGEGIESIRKATKDMVQSVHVAAVTRVAIVLRGIRGLQGICWATERLLEGQSFCGAMILRESGGDSKIGMESLEARGFFRLGKALLTAHDACDTAFKSWAGHREKRHARFSGRHFLEALASPEGSKGAARLFRKLFPLMAKILKVHPRCWTDRDNKALLVCSHGNLPLCVDQTVKFAAEYNSVNAGLSWMVWAQMNAHTPCIPFGEETFAVLWAGQSSVARQQLTAAGITTAYALERRRLELNAFAKPWVATPRSRIVLPAMVCVHMCEFAQVLNDPAFGAKAISQIIGLDLATYKHVVDKVVSDLSTEDPSKPGRTQCHLQILLTELKPLSQGDHGADGASVAAAGTSAAVPERTEEDQKREGASSSHRKKYQKLQWQIEAKRTVRCSICGREVRKDVMSRHQKTELCTSFAARGGAEAAALPLRGCQ